MSTKTRLWVLGTGIICAALIVFGIVGGLLPQVTTANSTFGVAASTVEQNDLQRAQLDVLKKGDAEAGQLSQELEELRRAIPATAASAEFVRELHEIEVATGAAVKQFQVIPPLGSGETVSDPSVEQVADGETDPATVDASASAQGASGLIPIPVQFEIRGTEEQVAEFTRVLQAGERLLTVELVVQEQDDSEPELWTSKVTGSLYASAE